MYIYGIGICKDDHFRYIFNTEITHLYENLDDAKKFAEELCIQSNYPINIYKYKLYKNKNDKTMNQNNKQLLYHFYLDYKHKTVIDTYYDDNKLDNEVEKPLCDF